MSCRRMGLPCLAAALLIGCSDAGKPQGPGASDVVTARSLVGDWSGEEEVNGVKMKTVRRYKKDGTFEGEVTPIQPGARSPRGQSCRARGRCRMATSPRQSKGAANRE